MNAALRSTHAIRTQGSLRGRRYALVGFPDGLANQESVPLLNGGSGGTDPQIRVLTTLETSETRKYTSPTDWLLTRRSQMGYVAILNDS